jgi:hypothetical protein
MKRTQVQQAQAFACGKITMSMHECLGAVIMQRKTVLLGKRK